MLPSRRLISWECGRGVARGNGVGVVRSFFEKIPSNAVACMKACMKLWLRNQYTLHFLQPFEEKNKDVFRLFFRSSAHFWPDFGAGFNPNTHIIFSCPLSTYNKLILKTIGNRKGDCARSCSRWQAQPEKICKSQRTNQCHSLRTLYWFVLCNLQIFSGCACHLEQLHACRHTHNLLFYFQ